MSRISKRRKKSALLWGIVTLLALLIALGMEGIILAIGSSQPSQQAAKRWQGEGTERFAQVSVFASEDAGFSEGTASAVKSGIQSALDAISNTQNWFDCFSTETSLSLRGEQGSVTVTATATGGDFFRMHSFRFLSGSGYEPEDFNPNRVVLDHNAAWQLFGSYDIVGQSVWLDEMELSVAGVVDGRAEGLFDGTETTAYGETPRVYLPYNLVSDSENPLPITCYEVVSPEPLDDFSLEAVKSAVSLNEKEIKIVENSARYSFLSLLKTIGGLWTRSMRINRIVLPWWENVAVVAEDVAALIEAGMLVFAFIGILLPIIAAIRFLMRHPVSFAPIRNLFDRLYDRHLVRQWNKTHSQKLDDAGDPVDPKSKQ